MAAEQGLQARWRNGVPQVRLGTIRTCTIRTATVRNGPGDMAMRQVRRCHDHQAGRPGVILFDYLAAVGPVAHTAPIAQGIDLTVKGRQFLADFGIDLPLLEPGRTPPCRTCMDWRERRFHRAGPVGRALLARLIDKGWLVRQTETRRKPDGHQTDTRRTVVRRL